MTYSRDMKKNNPQIENLFVSNINENAEEIKAIAAFQKLSKEDLCQMKREYLASIAAAN